MAEIGSPCRSLRIAQAYMLAGTCPSGGISPTSYRSLVAVRFTAGCLSSITSAVVAVMAVRVPWLAWRWLSWRCAILGRGMAWWRGMAGLDVVARRRGHRRRLPWTAPARRRSRRARGRGPRGGRSASSSSWRRAGMAPRRTQPLTAVCQMPSSSATRCCEPNLRMTFSTVFLLIADRDLGCDAANT